MQNWKDISVEPGAPLTKAIEILNATGMLFLIVVDEDGKLVGNLTDGDLRKGLIKHHNIGVSVADIMNKNTSFVHDWQTESVIKDRFQNPNIRALPIVDNNHFVIGCHFAENFGNRMQHDAQLVIMAGGFGSRMGDLTKALPKPMLPIKGKPILEHIIVNASKLGLKKITISTHFMAKKITSHFGDGTGFNVEIQYIHEENPLGTAGCLGQITEDTDTLIVINGDIYSDINFRSILDYHRLTNADATMGTHKHEITNPYGVVRTDGISIIGLDEKPVWKADVNAGVYVVNNDMKRYIGKAEKIDMTEFFKRLIENNRKTVAYPLPEKVIEIGTAKSYHSVNQS